MPSLSTANTYFQNRLWTDEWDNSNDSKKKTALAHAQSQINSLGISSKFSTEDYNKAVCEQALFLLNLGPEDRKRINLQSQGVQSIDISDSITETYVIGGIAFCPVIQQLIKKYKYQVGELV